MARVSTISSLAGPPTPSSSPARSLFPESYWFLEGRIPTTTDDFEKLVRIREALLAAASYGLNTWHLNFLWLILRELVQLPKGMGCYNRNELTLLVDDALDGYYDVNEACKLLKIAPFCTQDNSRLRQSVSTMVKMLKGEVRINNKEIRRSCPISDVNELNV